MATRYVSTPTARFEIERGDRLFRKELLWGDTCRTIETSADRTKVHARGATGWVATSALGTKRLLEIYVIDVGQGDAVLMRTPNGKWHLIDGGVSNDRQMTRKGAANFLRWKFLEDLGKKKVELQNVILTHPDFDHYGGLINVLEGFLPAADQPARRFDVEVDTFLHSGMGRFERGAPLGARVAGEVAAFPAGDHGIPTKGSFITELLDGKSDFATPPRPLTISFGSLASQVAAVPASVRRLSSADGFLPGYSTGACRIRVLGPVVEQTAAGERGLRWLADESKTRNGHSVVLRVDYRKARILLTGDLNTLSQRLLLSYHDASEFTVDVAKGCHHGSDDIHLDFVRAMGACATVISSGDNEDYAHPRPRVMGASARYGREAVDPDDPGGEKCPPLLYSTELARSVRLAYAESISVKEAGDVLVEHAITATDPIVDPAGRDDRPRPLMQAPLAVDLIYGLVNIRTDGETILLATMEEKGNSFDVRRIVAGSA
ncbi:MAG TPA: MBL fold metallo-hydrolase [Candidatus Kapabacteria bacterium]|nr:MBL fold metallo-hydrolase [Candidatus Kapabacteria bacterium]